MLNIYQSRNQYTRTQGRTHAHAHRAHAQLPPPLPMHAHARARPHTTPERFLIWSDLDIKDHLQCDMVSVPNRDQSGPNFLLMLAKIIEDFNYDEQLR